jgi:penicillin V acylase-like amidase (Ntn superfamily)
MVIKDEFMKTFANLLVSVLLVFSFVGNSFACTALIITDANGVAYQGRTFEFAANIPSNLTYFPVGTQIISETPDGKAGVTFNTKYAMLGTSAKVTPNAKQDAIVEGVNDQGLTISLNAFSDNVAPKIDADASKALSAVDFGAWALGNFQNVAQVKEALQNKQVNLWLPRIALMGNLDAPVHFALFDKTGAGIVIEFTQGQVMVYDNPVGVLTNTPAFPWHLENLNHYTQLSNLDKNSGQFNKLKVNAPDSGNALAGLPSTQISSGRFVKGAFYTNYVRKAKTPEDAISMLSHVMNNFDRPYDLSIDPAGSVSATEGVGNTGPATEVTYFTVMNDLVQNHFYIRYVTSMHFTKVDLKQLAVLKQIKAIPTEKVNELGGLDATQLFLK